VWSNGTKSVVGSNGVGGILEGSLKRLKNIETTFLKKIFQYPNKKDHVNGVQSME